MAVKPSLPGEKGPKNMGQIDGKEPFGNPREMIDTGLPSMTSLHNDIGEKSGFEGDTSGYIIKKGTSYGEAAKLNQMPPGMDISDQINSDIRSMQLKTITGTSYPGDGWEPTPRDVRESE